jgi:hypothetical protein
MCGRYSREKSSRDKKAGVKTKITGASETGLSQKNVVKCRAAPNDFAGVGGEGLFFVAGHEVDGELGGR